MEIRPLEAELFHADGRTDMTKQTVYLFAILRKPPLHTPKEKLCRLDSFKSNDGLLCRR